MIYNQYYIVDRKAFKNDDQFYDLRYKLLNITPWSNSKKYISRPFSIWTVDKKNKIYLPRILGIKLFGKPDKIRVYRGKKQCKTISSTTTIDLRKYQNDACVAVQESYKSGELGGILVMSPGSGKTYTAIKTSVNIGRKTLIIVPQKTIGKQWNDSLLKFGENAKIIKTGDNINALFDKYNYLISIAKTLCIKPNGKYRFNVKDFKKCGFVILDEIHSMVSEKYLSMFNLISVRYILALTATPKRIDNLNYLYDHYIGNTVYEYMVCNRYNQPLIVHNYIAPCENYKLVNNGKSGEVNYMATYKNIMQCGVRIKFIIKLIEKYHKMGKKILVVDMIRAHLEMLYDKTEYLTPNRCILYAGSELKTESDIIFGIYTLSKQGLDVPDCNCIILLSSVTIKKDIDNQWNTTILDQLSGRVQRKEHKTSPLMVILNDRFSYYKRHTRHRNHYFKKIKKWTVKDCVLN